MLQVKGLYKSYGEFELQDINFTLEKGYIMGLIGQNGAGKTSLIHLLLGLTRPEKGQILVCGHDMAEEAKEAKDALGYVLEENVFVKNLSVEKNGAVFGAYYSRYDHDRFLAYLEEFEVPQKKSTGALSKGMQIRFQLAFALAHEPDLLILDEAVLGLDLDFREKMLKRMQTFVEDGEHSILYATHLTEELDKIGDYILMLQKGRQLFYLDKETLYDRYQVNSRQKAKQQPAIGDVMYDIVKGGMKI